MSTHISTHQTTSIKAQSLSHDGHTWLALSFKTEDGESLKVVSHGLHPEKCCRLADAINREFVNDPWTADLQAAE